MTAGVEEIRTGRLILRGARLGRFLLAGALGALVATVVATSARLLGPLAVRYGIDEACTFASRDPVLGIEQVDVPSRTL